MKCSLCSFEFREEDAHAACRGCGITKCCELVKCPRCGFENAPTPKWLGALFDNGKREKNRQPFQKPDVPLNELSLNQKARVSFVRTEDPSALRKMIAIGMLPRTELVLLQRFPSFVLQVGFSQFSIDRELASCIHVAPIEIK